MSLSWKMITDQCSVSHDFVILLKVINPKCNERIVDFELQIRYPRRPVKQAYLSRSLYPLIIHWPLFMARKRVPHNKDSWQLKMFIWWLKSNCVNRFVGCDGYKRTPIARAAYQSAREVSGIILCLHSVNALSQWEMELHCNAVFHWLGAYTEWSLRTENPYKVSNALVKTSVN